MKNQYTQNNKVRLIINDDDFINEIIKVVKNAQKYVFIHTYIFDYDEYTSELIKELIKKAQEGTYVFLLLDHFGSIAFPSDIEDELKRAGVFFKYFHHLLSFKHLGRRLHQKVVLNDVNEAIVGGINIGKKFSAQNSKKAWLDYAVHIQGHETQNIFSKIKRIYCSNFKTQKDLILNYKASSQINSYHTKVMTLENDWALNKKEIYKNYLQLIKKAQSKIQITATYFIPSKKLLKYLIAAKKRGVEIELIFSKESDMWVTQKASEYLLELYLQKGIKVYIWDKSIIHGKMALFDSQICSIGSYNHNYISQFGNLELNCVIDDFEFSKAICNEFEDIKNQSKLIKNTEQLGYNKLLLLIFYIFYNLIALVSTILIYQKKHSKDHL